MKSGVLYALLAFYNGKIFQRQQAFSVLMYFLCRFLLSSPSLCHHRTYCNSLLLSHTPRYSLSRPLGYFWRTKGERREGDKTVEQGTTECTNPAQANESSPVRPSLSPIPLCLNLSTSSHNQTCPPHAFPSSSLSSPFITATSPWALFINPNALTFFITASFYSRPAAPPFFSFLLEWLFSYSPSSSFLSSPTHSTHSSSIYIHYYRG